MEAREIKSKRVEEPGSMVVGEFDYSEYSKEQLVAEIRAMNYALEVVGANTERKLRAEISNLKIIKSETLKYTTLLTRALEIARRCFCDGKVSHEHMINCAKKELGMPVMIRTTKVVRGLGIILAPGDYEPCINRFGTVSVDTGEKGRLGLALDEFEWVDVDVWDTAAAARAMVDMIKDKPCPSGEGWDIPECCLECGADQDNCPMPENCNLCADSTVTPVSVAEIVSNTKEWIGEKS